MNLLTDEQVRSEYKSLAPVLKDVFPIFKEHLQRSLRADVFMSDEQAFRDARVKYEYLDEMLQSIINVCTEE